MVGLAVLLVREAQPAETDADAASRWFFSGLFLSIGVTFLLAFTVQWHLQLIPSRPC